MRHNQKITSFVLTLALVLGSALVTTSYALPANPPAAEVVYHYGSTSLDLNDFESRVNQVIENKISEAGIATKTVVFSNLVSTDANAANLDSWSIYRHGDVQWPSTYPYPVGGVFTPPADKQHIQISADGKDMVFYGYTSSAFNDFMIYKDEIVGEKTFNFTIDRSEVYYHSMLGGGFLFNVTTTDGALGGYLLLYEQSQIALYQLTGVNIANLHEGTTGQLINQPGVSLITSTTTDSAVTIINAELIVNESGGKSYFSLNHTTGSTTTAVFSDYELPAKYGERFGPFASFALHGCSEVSIFGFKNLAMSITSTKSFSEALHDYNWGDAVYKFLVNIDDDSSEYASPPTSSAMIADLNEDNVYYIGVGVASNQAISTQFNRTNMGTYIVMPSDTVYDEIGSLIGDDLVANYKLSDLSAVAGNRQITLNFSPPRWCSGW